MESSYQTGRRKGLIVRLWRRITRRRMSRKIETRSSDLLTKEFFGTIETDALTSSTVSPASTIDDQSPMETLASSDAAGNEQFDEALGVHSSVRNVSPGKMSFRSTGTTHKSVWQNPTQFSNIYTLIDSLVREQRHPLTPDDERTLASVRSSSIFSTATPLCVFDDGSVTVGGKPFIFVTKRSPVPEAVPEEESGEEQSGETPTPVVPTPQVPPVAIVPCRSQQLKRRRSRRSRSMSSLIDVDRSLSPRKRTTPYEAAAF